MNKKRKEIRLRKLYSLREDVMARENLGGGAAPVRPRAALLQGRGRLEAEAEAGLAVAYA
jgi:hypothetical protein